MKKLKYFLPSSIAVVAAILVSIFLIEESIVILSCLAVGPVVLTVALVRCIHTKDLRWRALVPTLVSAIIFVGIAWPHIPLRLAFKIYRAEFDRAASQIETDTPPQTPFWIGPFKIKMAGRRVNSGTPYLSSNQDESEIDGFVKHPEGHGFNLWSCIKLDDTWSYIAED